MWDEDEFNSLFDVFDDELKDPLTKRWSEDIVINTLDPSTRTFSDGSRMFDVSDYIMSDIKSISGVDDITEWLDDIIPPPQSPQEYVMSQRMMTDDIVRRNVYHRTISSYPLSEDPIYVKFLGRDLPLYGQRSHTNLQTKENTNREDIRNIEDIRLDLIELCKKKEVMEYDILVYVGNGYWKPCKDRIWSINYRIEIMEARGYDVYPYNLIDDRGNMLKDKSSLRRLKNIKNTLQQKRNDIECKYKKLVERIDNSESKTELYLIEREL